MTLWVPRSKAVCFLLFSHSESTSNLIQSHFSVVLFLVQEEMSSVKYGILIHSAYKVKFFEGILDNEGLECPRMNGGL